MLGVMKLKNRNYYEILDENQKIDLLDMIMGYLSSDSITKKPKVEYARKIKNRYKSIFLIRSQDGNYTHVNPDNDKLFFIGILQDDMYLEIPYAYIDQLEMFKSVTQNIKNPTMRRNEIFSIKKYIDNFYNNSNLLNFGNKNLEVR